MGKARRDRRGNLFLVEAGVQHAYSLNDDARAMDREEWVAASGSPLLPLLVRAIELGQGKTRALVDSDTTQTLCIWGANPSQTPGVGLAWLVASNAAYRRVLSIHRYFEQGLADMHRDYPRLDAWAYHKNTAHHQWMLHFGFEKTGDRAVLGMGFDFLKFTRTET